MRRQDLLVLLVACCLVCIPAQAKSALVKTDSSGNLFAAENLNDIFRHSDIGTIFNYKPEAAFIAGRIIQPFNHFDFLPNFLSMSNSTIFLRINQFEDNLNQLNTNAPELAKALSPPVPKSILLKLWATALIGIIIWCLIRFYLIGRQKHRDQKLRSLMITELFFWKKEE